MADVRQYECSEQQIQFSPTIMFQTKVGEGRPGFVCALSGFVLTMSLRIPARGETVVQRPSLSGAPLRGSESKHHFDALLLVGRWSSLLHRATKKWDQSSGVGAGVRRAFFSSGGRQFQRTFGMPDTRAPRADAPSADQALSFRSPSLVSLRIGGVGLQQATLRHSAGS